MRSLLLAGLVLCAAAAGAEPVEYEPAWDSIDARPTPAWFTDAKFGIFIHWGVYAVPAWSPTTTYSEWYWMHMQDKGGATWKFHERTYGAEVQYQDFAPRFTAELHDPAQWADFFKRSGARYVVLTSKHHDGFALWPSAESWNWNAVDIGPHRDVLGDLTEAVRDAGLRMGFYYSLYEWFHPLYRTDVDRYVAEHMLPQLKDLVVKYRPAIVWTDGEWDHPSETWRSTEFLSWLLNESPAPDDVVINDRWGKDCRGRHGGFYTTEYGHHPGETVGAQHAWEECRGMGASFGYNRNETIDDYRSAKDLVRLLVETVSQGGNLLLDIGPTADGRIPVIMQERLVQMGQWLGPNGEGIYGTTAGPFPAVPWGGCTRKPGKLFLHVFDWPESGPLAIGGLRVDVERAYLLTDPQRQALVTRQTRDALIVELPPYPPDPIATVVVIEHEGELAVDPDLRAVTIEPAP